MHLLHSLFQWEHSKHYVLTPSFMVQGMECEVSYPMDTLNDLKAYDLCATTSPFEVRFYKFGYPTKCIYGEFKSHYCEDSELSLYDKCIVVKNYGEFSLDACGDSHKLHTIEHRDELKWITGTSRKICLSINVHFLNLFSKFNL
ncbi:hypothetical protein NECAME_03531 [Necator americanus]|uniref:Uncharacterized protein n=1 Tax=Necator americanus TaxID=51031 RepID=W2T2M0_NECAM|nr:hypothetical protein NECAME_03531 [Necator americanus]ETN76158.1 hypothetical protein NECAME_03531 [Necator americanus]